MAAMFQTIQACCHAVGKVIQTAFSLLSGVLFATKQVSTGSDKTLTIATTGMERAFEIKVRGVKERRIWRSRRRWGEERSKIKDQRQMRRVRNIPVASQYEKSLHWKPHQL